MKALTVVLSFEALPVSAFLWVGLGSPLPRRSWFWTRFAAVMLAFLLPDLPLAVARLGEDTAGMLLWLGFAWGMLLMGLSRFVLFRRGDLGPESDGHGNGDGGDGPPPGDRPPRPPAPIGGIPLPDADPASGRLRDHRPPRRRRPRRPVRRSDRLPSRVWPLRLWPAPEPTRPS